MKEVGLELLEEVMKFKKTIWKENNAAVLCQSVKV